MQVKRHNCLKRACLASVRVPQGVAEHPGEEIGLGVGPVPSVVVHSLVFSVPDVPAWGYGSKMMGLLFFFPDWRANPERKKDVGGGGCLPGEALVPRLPRAITFLRLQRGNM